MLIIVGPDEYCTDAQRSSRVGRPVGFYASGLFLLP